MKAPFPYFGGKSTISFRVWEYLGNPKHYIEPFFGSGAVLLNRPGGAKGKIETVCDKDGFLANVWRSIKFSPAKTAKWCDWPVNHADLMARKKVLIKNENHLLENLIKDDEWHDVKMAGYWIWAASCWIGSGLTSAGQIPHLGDAGRGINAGQIPHLCNSLGDPYNDNIYSWFRQLSERLRFVRVVCGDWTRVCGGNWQDKIGIVGIFFDPPYGFKDRDITVYHHDSTSVSLEVEKWCLERGSKPTYRIVCAGYEGEYQSLIDAGWTVEFWKANGGYGNLGKNTRGKKNKYRERLFVSPHCLGQQNVW